jgi:TRAP transporter TAXI family solute receptor
MKRTFSQWIIAILAITMVLSLNTTAYAASQTEGTAPTEKKEPYELLIAGASSTGQITRWVLALCNVINNHSDFVSASSLMTTGSGENVDLIEIGECDMGVLNSSSAYLATEGKMNWDGKPHNNIYYVGATYPEYCYFFTAAKSDINAISDIRGHVVNLETIQNAGAAITVLEALGYTLNDFTPTYNIIGDSCTSIAEGNIDVNVGCTGANMTAVYQLQASPAGLKIIPFTDEEAAMVCAKVPYYSPYVKDDFYGGMENGIPPTKTLRAYYGLYCNDKVPDEVVYEVLRIMYEYHDELVSYESTAVDTTVENSLRGRFIKWAPGAESYYRKIGALQ